MGRYPCAQPHTMRSTLRVLTLSDKVGYARAGPSPYLLAPASDVFSTPTGWPPSNWAYAAVAKLRFTELTKSMCLQCLSRQECDASSLRLPTPQQPLCTRCLGPKEEPVRIRRVKAKRELEEVRDDFITQGYKVKAEGNTSTVMEKKYNGSTGGHIGVALFTVWWTLGIGNLVYWLIVRKSDEVMIKLGAE